MWENVKHKFHTGYLIVMGLTFMVAPWDMYDSSQSYVNTVYSLILQPPHTTYPNYTVSISVESLISNLVLVSIIYGIIYIVCKKFVFNK